MISLRLCMYCAIYFCIFSIPLAILLASCPCCAIHCAACIGISPMATFRHVYFPYSYFILHPFAVSGFLLHVFVHHLYSTGILCMFASACSCFCRSAHFGSFVLHCPYAKWWSLISRPHPWHLNSGRSQTLRLPGSLLSQALRLRLSERARQKFLGASECPCQTKVMHGGSFPPPLSRV